MYTHTTIKTGAKDRAHWGSVHIGYLALITVIVVGFTLSTGVISTVHAQDTYVVDSNGDTGDNDKGNETCDDGSGNCTLRAAIEEANNDGPDRDIIEFSIPATGSFTTISASANMVVTEPLEIDGTTATGYPSSVDGPVIAINGSGASPSSEDGLVIMASDVTVRGLGVNQFPDKGIRVADGHSNVVIDNCFVGIAIDDGESDRGNGDAGMYVFGDNFTLSHNVISHNGGEGVYINGNGSFGTGLKENIIGLDWNGDAAAGNANAGVTLGGGAGVRVGWFGLSLGSDPVPNRNYIGANDEAGVFVRSSGHFISANRIGTDSSGLTATGTGGGSLGNGGAGVSVYADTTSIVSNVISGNASNGGGGNGITVGADNALGTINVDSTVIRDNVIGLNRSEDSALPNGDGSATSGGIVCKSSSGSGSGKSTVVRGNTIAGNTGQGIRLTTNCYDWTVIDNYIGTTGGFASGLGNQDDGIEIRANPTSTFFPSRPVNLDENVIVSNGGDGIDVGGSLHDVTNNYVGVAPNGTALANNQQGVRLDGTTGTSVSSVTVGGGAGVGNDSIGVHPTPNGTGNVIGANGSGGILIEGDVSSTGVRQNYVGTNPSGADFGNAGPGIHILDKSSTSSGHVLGYAFGDTFLTPHPVKDGDGNVIAFNDADGVSIGKGGSSDVNNVAVRGNAIYQNGGIGIDLNGDGTTTNDNSGDDADTGPNHLQNFPVIEDVTYDASTDEVTIDFRVHTTTGNAAFPIDVDFYAADSDASGEGMIYLGPQGYQSSDATTTKSTVIALSSLSGVTKNDAFVATATDANGNTSEFMSTAEPLPVELTSFDATKSGESSVKLSWRTASETNNAGFRVQHRRVREGERERAGMGDWQNIGFVESRASGGTTTNATTYRFSKTGLAMGSHQFRLKQIDRSGSTHLHEAVTVQLTMDEPVMLSAPAPNPVRGQASFSFAVREAQPTSITLYNVLGQKVKTLYHATPAAGEETDVKLESTALPSGVYFIRIQAGNHSRTQRMSVVK